MDIITWTDDALLYICCICDAVGFVLVGVVASHLQRSFLPAPDSLLGQRHAERQAGGASHGATHAKRGAAQHAYEAQLESAKPL